MDASVIIAPTMKWLWDKYGNDLVKVGWRRFQKEWGKFGWSKAEQIYRKRLRELYSTTLLLGYSKPVIIEGIYTDVYIVDTLSSSQHYDFKELEKLKESEIRSPILPFQKRKPIINVVKNTNRLFIVGKPGSGKTTLLKYLTLQSCDGKTVDTPIFVSLKEWADSELTLQEFITQQFEICDFPDPRPFVIYLLKKGTTLVMFDGLDEVEQSKHHQAISSIEEFSKRFHRSKIIVTCRIAAVDYFFNKFTYVEIADFSRDQVHTFCRKWYQDDPQKYKDFMREIQREENKGLYELARTPLLLALICLVFDQIMTLPKRRGDLYKEALDALLKKWDSTRGIKRDEIYLRLAPRRKEQLLSIIATRNFINKRYFIPKDVIIKQIDDYLLKLPPLEVGNLSLDAEAVLKAIESQHGLLVERAYGIYSFSHLTIQEYLVARYIIENIGMDTLKDMGDYLDDSSWREIILMVASLLDNADLLMQQFVTKQENIVRDSKALEMLLKWIAQEFRVNMNSSFYISYLILILIALILIRMYMLIQLRGDVQLLTIWIKRVYEIIDANNQLLEPKIHQMIRFVILNTITTDADKALAIDPILRLTRSLGVSINNFPAEQIAHSMKNSFDPTLTKYLQILSLSLDSLNVAIVSDRQDWLRKVFILPSKAG